MTITDVKARLSELVDRVEAGETVTITRKGRPVARLTRISEEDAAAKRIGLLAGQVLLKEDWDSWDPETAAALGILE